jgi:hypothetical protein
MNSTLQSIAISNTDGGQPESIFAYLKAGTYYIYIYKNGIQSHLSSCHAFTIGIAISPITSVLTQCNLQSQVENLLFIIIIVLFLKDVEF